MVVRRRLGVGRRCGAEKKRRFFTFRALKKGFFPIFATPFGAERKYSSLAQLVRASDC
jgi:hypothetical protein